LFEVEVEDEENGVGFDDEATGFAEEGVGSDD
jgi:hypothetical protein